MARIGFSSGFTALALINLAAILPLVFLVFKGQSVRDAQGTPKEHEDL
jgi:hypothetical protein